ncbi:MAG: response regulator [Pseudomonadota bacterium]|mgnify:CR=1 FL=1|uniref:response regulator n=1 Tax=Phenylobacterium sp. TaxID=1871053 RepID=UPI0025CE6A30|nr:response regulator [Phenylobacterium sp.]MBT9473382.1 response regulator [Phenylobacterium sp.]
MRLELLKILIAEDNRYTRVLLIEILRAIGIQQIYEAADGAEALQAMRAHAIDIVLTDLAMEPLDGIDFVRLLRNSPDSPNPMVPVLMITGHSTLRRIHEARDVGINEFLAKPITARGVIGRLQQLIDHARPFIRSDDYFGPDRRRRNDPEHPGPWRRAADGPTVRALRS